ncbi:hypothetical protein NL340_25985 [Klebsiella pneumoniae]|uniref:hypothetical protein n=1 Tax=Klebsiella pneumoniae TaxID=573 RepID=UPI00210060E4|nr:hypothetical protein [Klebsiella pneumoniae]MCP5837400.1 hypothetical protein [Klebsiella pneumoniae]MDZ0477317.1 hypothetical protein [Klebsiella pneumoniae]
MLRLAARSLVYLFTLLGFLLRPFTGRIRWAVPGWVTFAGNQLARLERGGNRYPKTISALLLLTAAVAAGSYYTWHWYQNKPKPVDVAPLVVQDISASVQRPSAVNYNRDDNSAQIVVVTFSRSAAPVTLIGKPVTGYRKYKPPFCSSSEVSYLKFPHSFTAQAPILTAGPA